MVIIIARRRGRPRCAHDRRRLPRDDCRAVGVGARAQYII